MQLRITWITERHSHDTGGMAVSSARLVNSLRDRGHRIEVLHLSGNATDGYALQEAEGVTRITGWHGELERLFFQKRKQLEGRLLVGFGGGLPGYLASIWGRWLGCQSIALFRGNDLDRLIHDQTKGWMVHQTLQLATLVGAVASEMCSRISKLRSGTTVFTPNGIIPDDWTIFPADRQAAAELHHCYSPDRHPLIGIFGQLKFKKGLDTVLELYQQPGFNNRARLLTVGDLTPDHLQLAQGEDTLWWKHLPFCRKEELLPLYLACDLVLIPSLYDGMPNVLLEAMLCERPIVAADSGGMPDVISHGDNGLLFEAGDALAVGQALEQLFMLTDEQRNAMSKAARQTVLDRFTARHEADILENALTGLLAD